jgi:hypothetical protein
MIPCEARHADAAAGPLASYPTGVKFFLVLTSDHQKSD